MNDQPYQTIKPGFITVCMQCHPGKSVLAVCPELPASVTISHGICRACRRAWLLGLGIDPDRYDASTSAGPGVGICGEKAASEMTRTAAFAR